VTAWWDPAGPGWPVCADGTSCREPEAKVESTDGDGIESADVIPITSGPPVRGPSL